MLAEGFTKVLIARELGTKEFRGVGATSPATVARLYHAGGGRVTERLYEPDPRRRCPTSGAGVTEYGAAVQNGAEG
jgi:hypothetical protein